MKHRALFGTNFAKGFGRAWLVGGFLFLYLPMLTLIIFSFNHSRLPTQCEWRTRHRFGRPQSKNISSPPEGAAVPR